MLGRTIRSQAHRLRSPLVFAPRLSSPMSTTAPKFKLALCQIAVGDDKQKNIATATAAVTEAAKNAAQVVSLPECWNSPYATTSFPQYAEEIPEKKAALNEKDHPSTFALSQLAAELQIYLVGGSIPEKDAVGKVYNTSVIFSPEGEILGKHRKVHLFDIDVPGKITFKESDTLSPGNSMTLFDTPYGKMGVGICYDIRFPELSMLMKKQGAKILLFPGAFNLTTGPAHWELLQRARAVDNQLYVAATSPARGPEGGYQAWGHSTVISPWGEVVATCGHGESIVYAEVDLEKVEEMRRNIPTTNQTRSDLYELVQK
ncbi:Omega-amidase [Phytophthora cactorum]|uniref:Omega-amidase n=2 Tax=Phytophthora cactorum TaxID=29920 RepID=A0A8T1HTX0_9STRA|nr:Omega-amidase [Phytophthora cactorum]KAG2924206.1 Omega-amidase [Phytophthora cactorum]KAG3150630.1 Omega-amidase [Phytophthora cactorum]KAG3215940.1 Omega-amidase [Phytophthora cactorum]